MSPQQGQEGTGAMGQGPRARQQEPGVRVWALDPIPATRNHHPLTQPPPARSPRPSALGPRPLALHPTNNGRIQP
jgi:hypothetical protein